MENQRDHCGNPICPVCGQPIVAAECVGKSDSYMVHIFCWDPKLRGTYN
jgi:hypothetical protein